MPNISVREFLPQYNPALSLRAKFSYTVFQYISDILKVFGITAPSTGSGKTTVTMAFLSLLKNSVPCKIGPDYIDPGLESAVTGSRTYNIDRWIEGRAYERTLSTLASRYDYAVVEGVMGLYDSGSPIDLSTNFYFRKFRIPYILVIDCSKTAESTYYIAKGFLGKRCIGVVLNNYGSEKHLNMVRNEFVRHGIRIIGAVPRDQEVVIESRHLGLHTGLETPDVRDKALRVSKYLDISFVDELPEIHSNAVPQNKPDSAKKINIWIAYDKAFNFYYASSLDYLERNGKINYFSPVSGEYPEDPDLVYFGGGYPEIFAEELSKNRKCMESVKNISESGTPVIAECGGLMYLEHSISTDNGEYRMAGIFPGRVAMGKRLTLSYTKMVAEQNSVMFRKGETVYGHEYHYSTTVDPSPKLLRNISGRGIDGKFDGLAIENTQATYSHFSLGRYGKRLIKKAMGQ